MDAASLEGKLDDVIESSANVDAEFAWDKQILLVIAYGEMHAASVQTAWETFDAPSRADTIVYVVTTDGDDENLYISSR